MGLSTHRLVDNLSFSCRDAVNSDAMGIQIQIFTRNVSELFFNEAVLPRNKVNSAPLGGRDNYLDYTTVSTYQSFKCILKFIKQQKDIFHLDMFVFNLE